MVLEGTLRLFHLPIPHGNQKSQMLSADTFCVKGRYTKAVFRAVTNCPIHSEMRSDGRFCIAASTAESSSTFHNSYASRTEPGVVSLRVTGMNRLACKQACIHKPKTHLPD